MRIVHVVVGSHNAASLESSITKAAETEELFICNDLLNFGPLKSDGLNFSEGRTNFMGQMTSEKKPTTAPIDDLERLMQLSTRLSNGEALQLWYWMRNTAADCCTYFWLLHFLKKHQGKLSVINLAGLPFLNEEGKLFYPAEIAMLPGREIQKARKLARPLTAAEWETDGEEWKALVAENASLRIHQGGKKLRGVTADFFDRALQQQIKAGKKRQKAIQEIMQSHQLPNGFAFLNWRISLLETSMQDQVAG